MHCEICGNVLNKKNKNTKCKDCMLIISESHKETQENESNFTKCKKCKCDLTGILSSYCEKCMDDLINDKMKLLGIVNDKIKRKLLRKMQIDSMNLTRCQKKAILYIETNAKTHSKNAYINILERFGKLGFSAHVLRQVIEYIKNKAPIIIQFNPDKALNFLIVDNFYRNQFETKQSGGTLSATARDTWEANMFNNIYATSTGFEKVKYGTLNILNDPNGIKNAYGYGSCHFVLKNVRLRTSFAACDTACKNGAHILATCEYYNHVLMDYTDDDLKYIVQIATGQVPYLDSGLLNSAYKETQIHGAVQLNRDIDKICMQSSYKPQYEDTAIEFAKKNNCTLVWL